VAGDGRPGLEHPGHLQGYIERTVLPTLGHLPLRRARRLALSNDRVQLLHEHRRRCVERAGACGVRLSDDAYVFSFDPAGRQPMHPYSVTHRFSRLA